MLKYYLGFIGLHDNSLGMFVLTNLNISNIGQGHSKHWDTVICNTMSLSLTGTPVWHFLGEDFPMGCALERALTVRLFWTSKVLPRLQLRKPQRAPLRRDPHAIKRLLLTKSFGSKLSEMLVPSPDSFPIPAGRMCAREPADTPVTPRKPCSPSSVPTNKN